MPTLSLNAELKAKNSVLYSTVQDMLNKKHLPSDFKPLDPSIFNSMHTNWNLEPFKLHRCPECMITIPGPKKLLLEHHKTHARRREIGENETFNRRYFLDY